MKKILLMSLFLIVHFLLVAQIKCTVKGKMINYPDCKEIAILKSGADLGFGDRVTAEVKNGGFEVTFETDYIQIYEIVIQRRPGSWQTESFCAINGTVEIQMDEKDWSNSFAIGGNENEKISAKRRYMVELLKKNSIHELYGKSNSFSNEQQHSVAGLQFWKDLRAAKAGVEKDKLYRKRDVMIESGEMYTPEYNQLMAQIDSLHTIMAKEEDEYDKKNPSLHEFSRLKDNLRSFKSFKEDYYKGDDCPLQYLEGLFKYLSKVYPKHPYKTQCQELLKALRRIETGKYIDFTAPDLDGNLVKLSSEIKGKVAIIDLWASWCGPCRRKSITYIPIYDEYKEKGFTIVGVAKEFKNDNAMRKAIEKDGYPWTNLIELDGKNGIWEKYGVSNGAGATFLVDKNGKILATNPTADEVREILEEKL